MTTLNLLGLCKHYFSALETRAKGEVLSLEQQKCLSHCNSHYNPQINNCNPEQVSLEYFKKLQERFPGAYLL